MLSAGSEKPLITGLKLELLALAIGGMHSQDTVQKAVVLSPLVAWPVNVSEKSSWLA